MLRRKAKSKYPSAARREEYADCHGIPFDEYRLCLPEKVSDWRQVVRVQDDSVEMFMDFRH